MLLLTFVRNYGFATAGSTMSMEVQHAMLSFLPEKSHLERAKSNKDVVFIDPARLFQAYHNQLVDYVKSMLRASDGVQVCNFVNKALGISLEYTEDSIWLQDGESITMSDIEDLFDENSISRKHLADLIMDETEEIVIPITEESDFYYVTFPPSNLDLVLKEKSLTQALKDMKKQVVI